MTRSFFERWLAPAVLAVTALTLYLLTLSNVHTYDALSYIRDVDGRTGFFFHPHHLLYSPTGWLFWQGWRLVGYTGNSELPLKVLNALAGACCGFGFYRLTLHLTKQAAPAAVAAGLLMFNFATWYFSAEVEVYLLALIWLVLALYLLIELVTDPRHRTAPLLGLALGVAALYHQTNVLLVPVVIVAMLIAPLTPAAKLRGLIVCGLVAGAIVALGYGGVGFGINRYRSFQQMRDWMLFYAETGWWGHATRDRWTDLGAGLGNTMSMEGALPYWIGVVATLLLGWAAARRRPRVVAVCVAWIAIYAAFFTWWEAENIEFWIATLLPLWLLVGLALDSIRPWQLGRAAAAVTLIGTGQLAWHNYPLIKVRGDASVDLERHLSHLAQQATNADDLIVEPGGVLELYLPYYEGRPNIRTINGALFETHGDVDQALGRLASYMTQSLNAGLSVLVGRNAMQLPPGVFQRYNVPQERLDAFWQPYRAAMEPAVTHEGETYFYRIPSATQLAQKAGWRWTGFDWGWQANNVTNVGFEAGWCFDPRPDPALISPVIQLDAEVARAVEVTLSTKAQGQTAQLFYAGPDGALSEERSVQWKLDGDGAAHTYRIPLQGTPGWTGTITRLRFDPIAVGNGAAETRTCLQGMRFVR
jgi:4-amino-4-deoxy-L-arabinose transferase-like glycosyltransferase